jgi:ubiquilin
VFYSTFSKKKSQKNNPKKTKKMPTLNIKLSNGSSHEVVVESITEGTVFDLKKALAASIDIPAESQRVVYKGRILKDGDALSTVGLLDGVALHVVRSVAAAGGATTTTSSNNSAPTPAPAPVPAPNNNSNPPPPPPPVNNPNPFASLFGGAPQTQQQQPQQQGFGGGAGGANPFAAMMMPPPPGMMGGNPNQMAAAAQMLQSNPQMQQMLSQLMQNPQMMRSVLQMDPTINSMPEPQRSQMLDLMTNPIMLQSMMSSVLGGGLGTGGAGAGVNPFAAMMGGGHQQQGAGSAAPNPFAAMLGGGMPGAGAGQMTNDQARTQYASQLQQLQSMGFPNEEANIRALIIAQGDVNFAIARLLGE